jgi:hypothetical protein
MPRKRLTLEALVEEGRLDARNWRHRRALDESREPLADAELEETRQLALGYRGLRGAKERAAAALREFAGLVNRG